VQPTVEDSGDDGDEEDVDEDDDDEEEEGGIEPIQVGLAASRRSRCLPSPHLDSC
jgi:hypothetical protein